MDEGSIRKIQTSFQSWCSKFEHFHIPGQTITHKYWLLNVMKMGLYTNAAGKKGPLQVKGIKYKDFTSEDVLTCKW